MRNLVVVLAAAACGGSSKPAMGPPPPPAKIGEAERAEPVERAAPTTPAPAPAAAPAPQVAVASDPEEGGQVASDPEEGGQVASASRPASLGTIGASGAGGGGAGIGQGRPGGPPPPSVNPGTPSVSGDIDREVIRRVIRRNINQIRYCYETALQKNPSLDGKVVVTFTIGSDGRVTDAKAEGIADELDRCLEKRFSTFVFPKAPAPAKIAYPINFTRQ